MLFAGIDSGTQSTKCIFLDADTGEIIAQAQEAYELVPNLPPGHLEQNPADWIDAVEKTLASCAQQAGERASELKGIGVSGQQHGLVVLDANDEVVRPAKLWCDTSTADQCDQFAAAFGGEAGLIEKPSDRVMLELSGTSWVGNGNALPAQLVSQLTKLFFRHGVQPLPGKVVFLNREATPANGVGYLDRNGDFTAGTCW